MNAFSSFFSKCLLYQLERRLLGEEKTALDIMIPESLKGIFFNNLDEMALYCQHFTGMENVLLFSGYNFEEASDQTNSHD
jgi:hypothetical protein